MFTYLPKTLLDLWKKSKLSVEMAIGHILQRFVAHHERLRASERQLGQSSHGS